MEEELLDLLDTMFEAYENGPACYEYPEELERFVGYAVKLDDKTFLQIANILNKHRPRSKHKDTKLLSLEALRDLAIRPHFHVEEDFWHSCCAHPDCGNDWNDGQCSCGADEHNKKVNTIFDNILADMKKAAIEGQHI